MPDEVVKRRGRPPKAAVEAQEAPPSFTVTFSEDSSVIGLAEYIKTKERDGAVLVEISHPAAMDGDIHQGVYSGIRLKRGALSAKYSDGTTE